MNTALLTTILNQHLTYITRLEAALDLQETRYNASNSRVDGERVLELCRELRSELDYGRYLLTQRPEITP